MPSQTVKNDLKAKNIKLPQMNFFPKKTNEIFKKLLEFIQSYEDVPFSGPKWPICPEQIFFGTNHYYYFHLPIGPFHCAKFLKIYTADPEL